MKPTKEPGVAITNAVEDLVYGAFDGPTDLAEASGITRQAIYVWLGRRMIWNRETALKMDALSAEKGHRVSASELMALVPWSGEGKRPARGADQKRGPSGNSRCLGRQARAGSVSRHSGATASVTRLSAVA